MNNYIQNKIFKTADRVTKENERRFLSFVPESPAARLLDIGCNNGELTLKIAEQLKNKEIYGLEIDRDKAQEAEHKGIKVTVADANNPFSFPDSFFDIVTANQIIEHLYSIDNFFKETHRVLKKEGLAIISSPNLCSWHNLFFMALGMQPPGMHLIKVQAGNFLHGLDTHGHIKIFSLKAAGDIARHYGFEIQRIAVSGYYPFCRPFSDWLSFLDRHHAVFFIMVLRKL